MGLSGTMLALYARRASEFKESWKKKVRGTYLRKGVRSRNLRDIDESELKERARESKNRISFRTREQAGRHKAALEMT